MKQSHTTLRIAAVLAILFSGSLLRAEPTNRSLTFEDCYRLAVKQSERLLQAEEDIKQALARRKQALGAVLPYLQWGTQTIWQDTSGSGNDGSGVASTLTKGRRTESKFTAEQPIFQGFKEFSAMSAYKAQSRRNEALLMQQSVNLYLNVAEAFYRVVQLEQFIADTRTSISLTEDRVKELRGRIRLGKSRDSEVLSSESQLSILRAQEARALGDVIAARDVLGFFIGQDARSLNFVDNQSYPPPVESEQKALQLGVNRSDVRAAKEDVEAKKYGIRVAKSGYYPKAGLVGNYYTWRPGFQSEIDWDVAFNLAVPLFQGGEVKGLAEEAKSIYKQSELELSRTMRFAESEIRQAQAALVSSINETNALQDSYEKSRRSYEGQRQDYRLGAVNNLDVLQALNAMQQTKANYNSSYLQTKLNYLKLKGVTEDIP